MATFFKDLAGAAGDLAQFAQHEIKSTRSQWTDKLSKIPIGRSSTRKECEFGDGPLGFTLEGNIVVDVEDDGQAEKLGVEIGDRLAEIAGYVVPTCKTGDVAEEEEINRKIRKWLKEMPRPSRLTFKIPKTSSSAAAAFAEEEGANTAEPVNCVAPTAAEADELAVKAGEAAEGADGVVAGDAGAAAAGAAAAGEAAAPEGEAQQPEAAMARKSSSTPVASGGAGGDQQQLKSVKRELAQTRASLEAERRKAAKLLEEVGVVRARNKELQASAARFEGDAEAARGAAEAREQALADEVKKLREAVSGSEAMEDEAGRLRGFLSEALSRAQVAETKLADLQASSALMRRDCEEATSRVSALESRANVAERRAEALELEVEGFHQALEAELELLRQEHAAECRTLRQRLETQEKEAAAALEKVQGQLQDALRDAAAQRAAAEASAVEAEAAAIEAQAARAAEDAAKAELTAALERCPSPRGALGRRRSGALEALLEEGAGDVPDLPEVVLDGKAEDMRALYDRIDVLERRCGMLQRKLSATVFTANNMGTAGVGQSHPIWLPYVLRLLGPRAGALSLKVFSVPDKALRFFTERLLKHTLGLWAFYVHLLLLYTMAATCTVSSANADATEPAALIDKQLAQAVAAAATSGAGR